MQTNTTSNQTTPWLQKSGIDYFDTYASVPRISTIRLLIAMTSIHNLIIHQMDVKIAFLNGKLDEEKDTLMQAGSAMLKIIRLSVAGYSCFGDAISWASKKQTCITGSIMEYEFMALVAAGKEAKWLRNLILEISLWSKPIAHISIRCDSADTLAKAYSQIYNGNSRYLGVRISMICELITNRVVSIKFMRSQQNLANHLTKGLARDLVLKPTEGIGLKSN
nr:zinc finger, CCHC-type [Tanacetum cinerariifolium]